MHNEKTVNQFWVAMAQIYGKKWYEEYGEYPNEMWIDAINELPAERLLAAVKVCRNYGDKYIINLSQFMGRARELRIEEHQYAQLPPPEVDKEQIEKYRKYLKSKFGKVKNKVRSIFLPGESNREFDEAKREALQNGISVKDFEWARLEANGWTKEDEEKMCRLAQAGLYDLYDRRKKYQVTILHETQI